jgi:hypothetical protein
MAKRYLVFLLLSLLPLSAILTQCLNPTEKKDPRGEAYAGAATCVSCHKNINNNYLHTAHFEASIPVNESNIKGPFTAGNTFVYNDHTKVVMTKTDSGFYQTSYVNGKNIQSARFDITFGGIKGESYLTWNGNQLLELPVSYDNSIKKWIISPGYDSTRITFDRAINTTCMECHASYAKSEPLNVASFDDRAEGFDKNALITGVDCERCHGPAKAHVDFHTKNPDVKKGMFLTSYKSMTRAQRIDLCGTCHSGSYPIVTKSIFSFKPGDTLSNYKRHSAFTPPADFTHIDVHGDQVDMLQTSKCYIASNMDCATCHNVHNNDHNNLIGFTRKCMNCHSTANHNFCKMEGKLSAAVLQSQCISCHMPALPSKLIVYADKSAMVRTHHIAVYPEETKKIIAFIKK